MVTQAMLGPILQLPDSYSTGQEPAPLLPASPSCCRNCPAWNNSRHRISVAAIAGRTGSWPQRAKRPPQCWGSTASAGGGICKRFVRVGPSGGILLPTTQQKRGERSPTNCLSQHLPLGREQRSRSPFWARRRRMGEVGARLSERGMPHRWFASIWRRCAPTRPCSSGLNGFEPSSVRHSMIFHTECCSEVQ